MTEPLIQTDVTGTVNLADPQAVANEVCAILARRYGDQHIGVVQQAFADITDAFWGRFPGLLACDTPYHDLRHAFGTSLLMTRMVDGYESVFGSGPQALGAERGTLAVLLALYHDIGFLRAEHEAEINGASLVHEHEERSVVFMRGYLTRGSLAAHAGSADLIYATDFSKPIDDLIGHLPQDQFVIGQMLGTADLLSQIAGRYYLERCRHFLFSEFVAAGVDRTVTPSGHTQILYATPEDLLRKTPGFFNHLVEPRLNADFEKVYRYVSAHFAGEDPYAASVRRNLDYLQQMIASNDFSGMRRKPVPLMPLPDGFDPSML
jgi:hypothetical protein